MDTAEGFEDMLESYDPRPWIILPGHTYGGEVGTFNVDFTISNSGYRSVPLLVRDG